MTRRRRDSPDGWLTDALVTALLTLAAVVVLEFIVRARLGELASWWVLGGVTP